MERDYFSQPVNKRIKEAKSSYYSQPPGYSHDEFNKRLDTCPTLNSSGSRHSEISVEDSIPPSEHPTVLQSEVVEDSVDKLFDSYKSISDELTSSLREYNSETISLENQLVRLNQENDYLKLEMDRQLAQIDELNVTSKNLSEKLTKEEAETKRIVELKLLEIQEMFGSIERTDKFITDFKQSFSESMVEAEQYCNNLKKEFKEFRDNFSNTSTDYTKNFNNYSSSCVEELNALKKNISDLEAGIKNDIVTVKQKYIEEAQIKQELNNVLQEIELEQKRRKDLENSLLQHREVISKLNRDHQIQQCNQENEIEGLIELHSQLKLKNAALDCDISSSENDLLNLKDRYNEKVVEMNSLQVVLVKKRHDDEMIQKEIELLEKQAEGLRNDSDKANAEYDSKKCVELELKELEHKMSDLMKKCEDLEETRKRAMEEDPSELIALEERNLEKVKSEHYQIQQQVDLAEKQLEQKNLEITSIQQESQHLRQIS